MGRKKVADEIILNALNDFKALTQSELGELLGYSQNSLYPRLKTMLRQGKIKAIRLPTLKTKTRYKILRGYLGIRLYYTTDEKLKEWFLMQIPQKLSPLYKKLMTSIINRLHLDLKLPESTTKKQLWIYDLSLYADLKKKAKKEGITPSILAEEIIRFGLYGKN